MELQKRGPQLYPPLSMGRLCREIAEMSPYPNKSIAIAGAMSLAAGVCGRKFNVMGLGLNLYVALLGPTGVGKSNLKDSVKNLIAFAFILINLVKTSTCARKKHIA